jgi:hypothetical protein
MEEISTSFCFICLLHLANEQGLKLESTVDDSARMEEVEEDVKKVGNIWDLKVCWLPISRCIGLCSCTLDIPRSKCNAVGMISSFSRGPICHSSLHLLPFFCLLLVLVVVQYIVVTHYLRRYSGTKEGPNYKTDTQR